MPRQIFEIIPFGTAQNCESTADIKKKFYTTYVMKNSCSPGSDGPA